MLHRILLRVLSYTFICFIKLIRTIRLLLSEFNDSCMYNRFNVTMVARWLTGRASDLCIADTGFDSRPGRCRVRTFGKFLTPMCNVVPLIIIIIIITTTISIAPNTDTQPIQGHRTLGSSDECRSAPNGRRP